MKNSLKYIATIAFLLLPHSYAQQSPAGQLPSVPPNEQPAGQLSSAPTVQRPPAKQDLKEKNSPCIVPAGTEIIHIPAVKHWSSYSEVLQTMQETREVIEQEVDDAVQFLESTWEKLTNSKDADEKGQEAGESDSERQYILDEEAYPHYVLARLIQDIPHSFIFHEFLTQVYDIRDVSALMSQRGAFIQGDPFIQNPAQLQQLEKVELKHLVQLVKTQFSEGLPEEYDDLTEDQKYSLAIAGGAPTLLFLNKIPLIYPSISPEDHHRYQFLYHSRCGVDYGFFNKCSFNTESPLQMMRVEKLASIVSSVLDHFSTGRDTPAILIYNKDQDLKSYFKDRNFYKVPDHCLSLKSE